MLHCLMLCPKFFSRISVQDRKLRVCWLERIWAELGVVVVILPPKHAIHRRISGLDRHIIVEIAKIGSSRA